MRIDKQHTIAMMAVHLHAIGMQRNARNRSLGLDVGPVVYAQSAIEACEFYDAVETEVRKRKQTSDEVTQLVVIEGGVVTDVIGDDHKDVAYHVWDWCEFAENPSYWWELPFELKEFIRQQPGIWATVQERLGTCGECEHSWADHDRHAGCCHIVNEEEHSYCWCMKTKTTTEEAKP